MIKKIMFAMAGVGLMLAVSGCSLKGMMVHEHESPYGVDETVEKIVANAKSIGWVVGGVKPLDQSVMKHGGPKLPPIRLIELCNAQHAGNILSHDDERYASVMMPCTVAVYTKSDGKTYVTHIRADKMGPMMGGEVSKVMKEVAVDQDKMLEFLTK